MNTEEIYMRTQAASAKQQQHLLFIDGGNDRCNSGTQISALAWQTVHKHIAA